MCLRFIPTPPTPLVLSYVQKPGCLGGSVTSANRKAVRGIPGLFQVSPRRAKNQQQPTIYHLSSVRPVVLVRRPIFGGK